MVCGLSVPRPNAPTTREDLRSITCAGLCGNGRRHRASLGTYPDGVWSSFIVWLRRKVGTKGLTRYVAGPIPAAAFGHTPAKTEYSIKRKGESALKKMEHFICAWVDEDGTGAKVMVNATGLEVAAMIYAILNSLHESGHDAAVQNALYAFFDGLEDEEN